MSKRVNRKFRKLSIEARIAALLDAGVLSKDDAESLLAEKQLLGRERGDRMIENVLGSFSLPQGVAINFPLNDQLYTVPLVVEEPSVVAALSYAGLLSEKSGGFYAEAQAPILIGQIQVIHVIDINQAERSIAEQAPVLLEQANSLMPAMLKRGGGAQSISTHHIEGMHSKHPMLIVHIAVNTCDAMGANLVNSVCEALAPKIEALTGGQVLLKILSNLADQALATARVRFSPGQLATKDIDGVTLRDRIILANDFALADPYRATTHNKGIMNGIDALALATGNDWRSIEAAAHAYAARSGQYRALTQWYEDEEGYLAGELIMPMKVGTVGGSLETNPAVPINQRILGKPNAQELAGLMVAVGLAQNFAALRALVSGGIQKGHMTLHARSVALTADAPAEIFDQVVKCMVDENVIKVWRAKELIDELLRSR